jgi:hypothetical protein
MLEARKHPIAVHGVESRAVARPYRLRAELHAKLRARQEVAGSRLIKIPQHLNREDVRLFGAGLLEMLPTCVLGLGKLSYLLYDPSCPASFCEGLDKQKPDRGCRRGQKPHDEYEMTDL